MICRCCARNLNKLTFTLKKIVHSITLQEIIVSTNSLKFCWNFQKVESEYQLSAKLSLVEKDPVSAIELLKHVNTMLKILTIGTSEEQTRYISIWTNMVSVCAQELKHGALIWKQAVEKNVESHLLVEPHGCKFILALGEIYRAVVVLGASAKLFKPWTISSSEYSLGVYMLLEECHTVWSTSELEEVPSNISARTAY